MLRDVQITNYDFSADGKLIFYSALDSGRTSRLWLSSLDHRFPPRELSVESSSDETFPVFGANGELYFLLREGKSNYDTG